MMLSNEVRDRSVLTDYSVGAKPKEPVVAGGKWRINSYLSVWILPTVFTAFILGWKATGGRGLK
jgi:hypothetical protein